MPVQCPEVSQAQRQLPPRPRPVGEHQAAETKLVYSELRLLHCTPRRGLVSQLGLRWVGGGAECSELCEASGHSPRDRSCLCHSRADSPGRSRGMVSLRVRPGPIYGAGEGPRHYPQQRQRGMSLALLATPPSQTSSALVTNPHSPELGLVPRRTGSQCHPQAGTTTQVSRLPAHPQLLAMPGPYQCAGQFMGLSAKVWPLAWKENMCWL